MSKLEWSKKVAYFQCTVMWLYPGVDDIPYEKLVKKFYRFALKHSLEFLMTRTFYITNNKIKTFCKNSFLVTGKLISGETFNIDDLRQINA